MSVYVFKKKKLNFRFRIEQIVMKLSSKPVTLQSETLGGVYMSTTTSTCFTRQETGMTSHSRHCKNTER